LEKTPLNQRIASIVDVNPAVEVAFSQQGLLLVGSELGEAFFDLRTGLAGELFQKFVNYRLPLAIVLPDSSVCGDRCGELVREHHSHPLVRFFPSSDEASTWLRSVRE
jgi:hypothetical protein